MEQNFANRLAQAENDLKLRKRTGVVIGWNKVDRDDYLFAIERSPIKDIEIKCVLKQALTAKINDIEIYIKGINYCYYYEEYFIYKTEKL